MLHPNQINNKHGTTTNEQLLANFNRQFATDQLQVQRSTIGRTNKLKTVRNSLGGKFVLDYKASTPSYMLPGRKWVLSQLTMSKSINPFIQAGQTMKNRTPRFTLYDF